MNVESSCVYCGDNNALTNRGSHYVESTRKIYLVEGKPAIHVRVIASSQLDVFHPTAVVCPACTKKAREAALAEFIKL